MGPHGAPRGPKETLGAPKGALGGPKGPLRGPKGCVLVAQPKCSAPTTLWWGEDKPWRLWVVECESRGMCGLWLA